MGEELRSAAPRLCPALSPVTSTPPASLHTPSSTSSLQAEGSLIPGKLTEWVSPFG